MTERVAAASPRLKARMAGVFSLLSLLTAAFTELFGILGQESVMLWLLVVAWTFNDGRNRLAQRRRAAAAGMQRRRSRISPPAAHTLKLRVRRTQRGSKSIQL
jgi:hypothetical protein